MDDWEQIATEIAKSGLFDEAWYTRTYQDVAEVGLPPLEHFVRFGMLLRRDPGPGFDMHLYLETNGDVAEAGIDALIHYIRFGKAEGRAAVRGRFAHLGAPLSADGQMPQGRRRHEGQCRIEADRPTILICAHSVSAELFGGERSLLDVLTAVALLPVNVIVTLPAADNHDYFLRIQSLCAAIYTFNYPQWMENRDVYAWSALDFADIISREAVDIVYANTIVLFEPMVAARKMGRTAVIHVRELISLDDGLQQQLRQTADYIVDSIFERSDWLIGNSRATCELFSRDDRTIYVPNAVTIEDFEMRNAFGAEIRFGIVSSNLPKKGIADFVEVASRAADRTPRARFVIVGPKTAQIEQWMDEVRRGERPDNLVFAGYQADARTAIAEINVLLNLSTFAESFGRTVAEAMAAGRPVIAYRWGALPELVQHGKTGYLVPFRDIDGVVDAIVELCENGHRIGTMGEEGRAFITENFSQERLNERMAEAYERITERSMRERGNFEGSRPLIAKAIGVAPPVSVIIPIFNAPDEVRACIASVLKHTELAETEIILIDDASSDDEIAQIFEDLEDRAGIRLVRSPQNLGYTRTVNLGIELAAGRDVILLNSDTIVTPRWLEGLRATAYSRAMIATATAMSDNAGAFSFPLPGQRCEKPAHLSHEEYALLMVQGTFECPPPVVPTGSGFCLFIRRAAIDACGSFDVEGFPRGYGEENDFCMRSEAAGWTHLISPWAFVFHVRTASFKAEKDQLVTAAIETLNVRYPGYDNLVREAFSGPSITYLREASAAICARLGGNGQSLIASI